MRKWTIFGLIIFAASLVSLNAAVYKKTYKTAADWDETLYDWKIDVTTVPGQVRLLKTELIADEMGITTAKMEEIIKGKTWAKKEFLLDSIEADKAVLLIHWNELMYDEFKKPDAFIWVDVNGHPIKLVVDFERMLTGGWIRCDVPVDYLRPGLNTVILRNETGYNFFISAEASRIPNRSAKSIDGGKTWDYNRLGRDGFIDGEYLIRLRLSRYPADAEILSDYIDVASLLGDGIIRPDVKLKALTLSLEADAPRGTSLTAHIRGGKTPAYCPETWSSWVPAAGVKAAGIADWKYLQWRVNLRTRDRRVTPSIKGLTLTADVDRLAEPSEKIAVKTADNPKVVRGYYPFVYQHAEEPRLKVLRDRYRLNEVVGGCSTEFQQYRTLAFWVKGAWRDAWGKHGEELHTPWDALISLELAPQYKASGMCVIYSNTYIQSALAVGLQGRGNILDHHFVSEVWSNDYKKWILMDVGNNPNSLRAAFMVKDGVPLNSLEIHNVALTDRFDDISVTPVGVQDPFKGGQDTKEGVCGPRQWKPRFGMPLRNNYLTSWMPGELEHGFIQYHYDGYLWWKDTPVPKHEEYTYQSSHARDFYWTLNHAHIFLTATEKPEELRVELDSVTPNFKEYQVSIDGQEWRPMAAPFTWTLHAGDNSLEIAPFNSFGRKGIVSSIRLAY